MEKDQSAKTMKQITREIPKLQKLKFKSIK